jgi:hypothetical protein
MLGLRLRVWQLRISERDSETRCADWRADGRHGKEADAQLEQGQQRAMRRLASTSAKLECRKLHECGGYHSEKAGGSTADVDDQSRLDVVSHE